MNYIQFRKKSILIKLSHNFMKFEGSYIRPEARLVLPIQMPNVIKIFN